MVDYGLDRTALIALKGNVTFHENVKVYEHDYKYTEFKNVFVKIKEEGLIFTYKKDGEFVDYRYDYMNLSRIEASDKVLFKLNDEVYLNPRFKAVHAMPGDDYYVVDSEQNWNDTTFEIVSVQDGKTAENLADFLNHQEDKMNVLNCFYNLFTKDDGGYKVIDNWVD